MSMEIEKSLSRFIDHFKYAPALANDFYDNEERFADFLERSVKDNVDYTIEEYGTEPPKRIRNFWGEPIID